MNRKYSGFTLVEMLIVMGIIIILMVVGITAGGFAINRANDVTHRNAVDQIYTSLQAYYTDEREYPKAEDCGGTSTNCTVASLIGPQDALVNEGNGWLVPYIDKDAFDGGSEATYWYGVGGDGGDQAVLVCVSLRGAADENLDRDDGEIYCNGNGYSSTDVLTGLPAAVPGSSITGTTALSVWTGTSGGSTWDNGWK